MPPRDSIWWTASGVLDGLREVARTRCPALRAVRARCRPKPEEQPVISQIGDVGRLVVGMVGGGGGIDAEKWN